MKQLARSGIKQSSKVPLPSQQTRRSMISRQQCPASIHQPNIQDILALQLSDTLINAAYNLAVTKISVGIQRLCNPLQSLFYGSKCFAFQNIRIYANRKNIDRPNNKNRELSNSQNPRKQSQFTQIDLLKQSSIYKPINNQLIILTKQQQRQKVYKNIKQKLNRMIKIVSLKINKIKMQSLIRLSTFQPTITQPKPGLNNSIQQTFQKYQQTRMNNKHFHRRSIDKTPYRKSHNQLTYSLNKHPQQFSRVKSPQNKLKSKNLLYNYNNQISTQQKNDKKASTCSHTQSNNSNKQVQASSKQYYTNTTNNSQTNSILNRLKGSTPAQTSIRKSVPLNSFNASSFYLNGSYFAQGTKQRQLQILRSKYYRLVQEFKDFSQRFLQVIKQE